jgi:hypothetical protein
MNLEIHSALLSLKLYQKETQNVYQKDVHIVQINAKRMYSNKWLRSIVNKKTDSRQDTSYESVMEEEVPVRRNVSLRSSVGTD